LTGPAGHKGPRGRRVKLFPRESPSAPAAFPVDAEGRPDTPYVRGVVERIAAYEALFGPLCQVDKQEAARQSALWRDEHV
jgi:hypothetical protein